jgi:hypothetical protein
VRASSAGPSSAEVAASNSSGLILGIDAVKGELKAAQDGGESLHTVSGLTTAAKGACANMADPSGLARHFRGLVGHVTGGGGEAAGHVAEDTPGVGTAVPTAMGQVTEEDQVPGQKAVGIAGDADSGHAGVENLAKLVTNAG